MFTISLCREGGSSLDWSQETPVILTPTAYESQSGWATLWKPEQAEKLQPEFFVRDQKNGRDHKKSLAEFKRHADTVQNEDEIWYAKDLPIMHQLSCMNSKKNKNCMGCSPFWKCVQTIQDDIRPWGSSDLLHYEPEHSETFLGYIAMNGSFSPQQTEMLACDGANTLVLSSAILKCTDRTYFSCSFMRMIPLQ